MTVRYQSAITVEYLSAAALSIYLTVSVTALPPTVVILPLLVSGLLLVWGSSMEALSGVKREAVAVIAAFLLSYMISTVFSYSVRGSLNACMVLFPGLLIGYICCHLAVQYHRAICWGIAGMVLSASLTTLWMFLASPESDPGKVFMAGKTSSLVVANDMVLGVVFAPVVVYLLMTERRFLLKVLSVFVLLVLVITLYFVKSRICFLTAVFMFALYLHRYTRRNFVSWFLVSIGVVFLIDALLGLKILHDLMLIAQQNARLSIWFAGLTSVFQHPIFGFGPAMFYMVYEQTVSNVSFPEWMMIDARTVPWAHNFYLDALVERGLVGLLVLLGIVVKIYKPLSRYAHEATGELNQFQFAIYVSFLGFLFAGFFELSMQRIWVANAFFLFVGLSLVKTIPITSPPKIRHNPSK